MPVHPQPRLHVRQFAPLLCFPERKEGVRPGNTGLEFAAAEGKV